MDDLGAAVGAKLWLAALFCFCGAMDKSQCIYRNQECLKYGAEITTIREARRVRFSQQEETI